MIVAIDEVVEAPLLRQQVAGGGLRGFLLPREMNAFVPAVLRRVAGRDGFYLDAKAYPPDGELAQAK